MSIDEQMIPYRGHHLERMFMKSKPIRFGYKAWTLASSDGYMYAFDLYTGKSNKKKTSDGSLGLSRNVVVDLLQIVEKKYYAVYFANFFASFDLLAYLNDVGYYTCVQCKTIALKIVLWWIKKLLVRKKEDEGWYKSWFEKTIKYALSGRTIIKL